MKYQPNKLPAVEKFDKLKSGVIFMKSGLEKIRLAFELIRAQLNQVDYIIWIAPRLKLNSKHYKKCLEEYSAGIRSKFYFFQIEQLSYSDICYLELYNLTDRYKTFCVVDNGLTIKNTKSGRTKKLLAIAEKFKYKLILSSLPLTQGLVDLYSQLQFMNSRLLNMTETQFAHNFLPFIENEFNHLKRWSFPPQEESLIRRISPFIFDCDFDFNDNIKNYEIFFDLTEKETSSYFEEKCDFLQKRNHVPFMQIVHKFQRIYTICKTKVEALFEIISEIRLRHEKVIIFVKFLDEIKFFRDCGWFQSENFVVLTGKTNKKKAINLFQNNVDIMFSSYGVDNSGLDMQICNNVIFFSQTFDYKLKIQLLRSMYSVDKTRKINIYNFWVRTGLDEMIRKNLLMKHDVLTNVCNIISREEALKL